MIAVTTPWLLWGYTNGVGVGTGPFFAGYSAASLYYVRALASPKLTRARARLCRAPGGLVRCF